MLLLHERAQGVCRLLFDNVEPIRQDDRDDAPQLTKPMLTKQLMPSSWDRQPGRDQVVCTCSRHVLTTLRMGSRGLGDQLRRLEIVRGCVKQMAWGQDLQL